MKKKVEWAEWQKCKYCDKYYLKESLENKVCYNCKKIIEAYLKDKDKKNDYQRKKSISTY